MIAPKKPMKLYLAAVATLLAVAAAIGSGPERASAASFESRFETTHDRIWPGRAYWPNPMENWRVRDGRLECTHGGQDRNVHLLTRALSTAHGAFETSVTLGVLPEASQAASRFELEAGEALGRPRAPRIAGRPLTLTATLAEIAPAGVIVAQGGASVGFSLWMDDGKLTFTTRREGEPTSVATEPLDRDSGTVQAVLKANGGVILRVDGKKVATGEMPGPLPKMPLDPLEVGRDGQTQVGPYDGPSPFQGQIEKGVLELKGDAADPVGAAGFRVGIDSEVAGYRAAVFYGEGLDATVATSGRLRLGEKTKDLGGEIGEQPVRLTLRGEPVGRGYTLTLVAQHATSGKKLGHIQVKNIERADLVGNLALVNNPRKASPVRFWFRRWRVRGPKVEAYPERAFGPILWTMHTLTDTGTAEGHVMKMSAQMPPLGEEDNDTVALQIRRDGQWKRIRRAKIDPAARTALFRVPHWDADRDIPYRVVYETTGTDGEVRRDTWGGTIRKSPDAAETVTVAGLNCQHDSGYPYGPVARNLRRTDPDVLFFAGDQLYEGNGGYGIVRRPADKAIVSYLRKYYMHGWVFREAMRSRPTLCIPDDHDVFQGNIWGEGGAKLERPAFSRGGYIEPVKTVNAIYRTQTGHHPGVQNLETAQRGISVFYGDMVYGGISFGVVADRQFKTGAQRADEAKKLRLLGGRQLEFLRSWVGDWEGAEMKLLLSQTQWADVNTHGGSYNRHKANRDTGGWPKVARDRAVRIARKGFAFHMNGDQHLPTLVHQGVASHRDAFWGFCPPAVSVGYQRWFVPDRLGMDARNRPAHGLPNTGAYTDGFGNPMYVYAVGNPTADSGGDRYARAHNKSSGFGLVRFNKAKRTIQVHAYRFAVDATDPTEDRELPGWPTTVDQLSNYGRDRAGRLPAYRVDGVEEPVVKVYHQDTGELVYALRAPKSRFRPFVFEKGTYKVRIGDPATDTWKVYEKQRIASDDGPAAEDGE